MAQLIEAVNGPPTTMSERDGKYLTFTMAEEEYGISILKVKEIIGMMPASPRCHRPLSS